MFRPPFLRTSSEVFKHPYQILFILSKKHVSSQCPSSLSRVRVKTERSLKDQLKVHYIIYVPAVLACARRAQTTFKQHIHS
jgi:hypothetical protein